MSLNRMAGTLLSDADRAHIASRPVRKFVRLPRTRAQFIGKVRRMMPHSHIDTFWQYLAYA